MKNFSKNWYLQSRKLETKSCFNENFVTYIGNCIISSSKKHLEKTDQDWCKNSNKSPRTCSSKINTWLQFFDQSNVSKNMQSQRVCVILPDAIKAGVFSETEQLFTWDDTYPNASQPSVSYLLDHRTTVSNYDSQFGWELSTYAAVRICYYGSDLTHGLS